MVQFRENQEWKRFIFLIESKSNENGKLIHRTAISNNGVDIWDALIIVEAWHNKKKNDELLKIQRSLPDNDNPSI